MIKLTATLFALFLSMSLMAQTKVDTIYTDGQKCIVKSEISANVVHGKRTFSTNGKVFLSQEFKFGIQHGTETWYHPNGNVSASIPFRNGRLHGERVERNISGKVLKRLFYFEGQVVDEETFTTMSHLSK